jgi:hypothetical protein
LDPNLILFQVDTVDWRSQLEQEISLNDKYSQYIRLDDDYDAEDLFKIFGKYPGTYCLRIDSTKNKHNVEWIQKIIESNYVAKLDIYLSPNENLRYILEGLKSTTMLTHLIIGGIIAKNEYGMIDDALSQNKSIIELKIAAPLYETLKIHPKITKLEVSINTEDNGSYEEDVASVLRGLEQNKTITRFGLSDKSDPNNRKLLSLSDESCKVMQKFLLTNSTVEKLSIVATVENESGCEYIADGLAKNTSISQLELWMMMNDRNMKIFKNAFAANKTLRSVNLLHGRVIQKVGELFANSPAIKALYLRTIDEQFVKNAILPTCALEELSLSYDYYDPTNPDLLVELLTNNKSIKKLYIETDIKKHSTAIGAALLKNNTLTHLTVSFYEGITLQGLNYILEALKTNTSLISLNFGQTYMLDSPADPTDLFIEVLKSNKTLEKIDICSNVITGRHEKRMKDIIEALKENESITSMNEITYYGFEELLADLFAKNEALLSFGRSYSTAAAHGPSLVRNRQLRLERIMLVHNMARSQHLMSLLPHEVWCIVLGHLRFPGIKNEVIRRIVEKEALRSRQKLESDTRHFD